MVRSESDDLVVRASRGDEDAWAELYGDHAERLVVWLGHLPHLDPATDAEDIAAEAWLTAARKVGEFRGDRSDFAGWLFGIARNHARSRSRSSAARNSTPVSPDAQRSWGEVDDPAPQVAATDLARRLVARLPEREAQVVACLDVVGLDVATASAALGISRTAVRVAHHRGLRRLRGLLEEADAAGASAGDVTLEMGEGM
jgi:RNA polymerase sigma-70 factor (ECF subfamily)